MNYKTRDGVNYLIINFLNRCLFSTNGVGALSGC